MDLPQEHYRPDVIYEKEEAKVPGLRTQGVRSFFAGRSIPRDVVCRPILPGQSYWQAGSLKRAGLVPIVGADVEEAVPGKVEEYHALLSLGLGL